MSGFLKSNAVVALGIGTLVGIGTVIYFKDKPSSKSVEPTAKIEKAPVPKSTSPLPPPADYLSNTPAKEQAPVDSNATIAKSTLTSLRETFAEMGKLRDREHSKDKGNKKVDPSEKRALAEKIKDARRDVMKAVRDSDAARKQLMDAVKEEKDPYAKKELAHFLREAAPDVQEKYYTQLASDPASDNQKVAAEMLGGLHTQSSLTSLVGMVDNSSADAQVRSEAVRSLAMSIPFASDNAAYQESARTALVGMIQPQYDAGVRNDAYRAIAMQSTLSPEDERVITQAIEKETDPQVKRTAEFVQNVINARKGNAVR